MLAWTYCCLTRDPSGARKLNRTFCEFSLEENRCTGIETSPKETVAEAMERAAMCPPHVM